ncbi:cupin domain-containing protein [Methylobrevis albus]|uniref:Cupin domain-containing protein n=1 Tax=Methylobrevis albus TaxID=2793297 RepID=A0A931I247_9HYPH|nr:cupin domain-containing protein [Methylobrevis albus]MBH0237890.1 cupin domain-containing protein [Methylobrevis albus]
MTAADPRYLPFDLAAVVPEDGAPDPEKVVKGEPRTRTWNVEETPDGKVFSGVWEATPGIWRVSYDEWEFCSILAGISLLHEDGVDAPHRLSAGDSFVIRPGFTGLWEVVETTRKLYVIRLP